MIRHKSRLSIQWQYYRDLYQIGDSRKQDYVMLRHAFMVASRELFTTTAIAQVMGKNHATVLHATRNHEMNYRFSELYQEGYAFAKNLLKDIKEINDLEFEESGKFIWVEENIKLRTLVQELKEEVYELRNPTSTPMGTDGRDKLLELHI